MKPVFFRYSQKNSGPKAAFWYPAPILKIFLYLRTESFMV